MPRIATAGFAEAAGADNAMLGPMNDPEASALAHAAGIGGVIETGLGGRPVVRIGPGGPPMTARDFPPTGTRTDCVTKMPNKRLNPTEIRAV